MNLHKNIMIETDFIPESVRKYLINYIKQSQLEDLTVFDADRTNATGEIVWKQDKAIRDTQTVDIIPVLPLVKTILDRSVKSANDFFNIKITSSEPPQILRYGVGGHYSPHVDGESTYNNGGIIEWRRNLDRDISFVYYLNDDYKGGNLVFPELNISLQPQAGMMVAFPSYHQFLHGVQPVTEGERFCLVAWMSIRN